jgi:predicted NBD/HSP70 family sugar kinase
VQFNARFGLVAGIVLGEATTRLAVADLAGETLASTEAATPPDDGPEPCRG